MGKREKGPWLGWPFGETRYASYPLSFFFYVVCCELVRQQQQQQLAGEDSVLAAFRSAVLVAVAHVKVCHFTTALYNYLCAQHSQTMNADVF
jgi:hypothetical protein